MSNRHILIKAAAIWRARADWYPWHLAHFNYLRDAPEQTRRLYHAIASQHPEPVLTVFGSFPHDWPPPAIYAAADLYGLNAEYACTYYTTPAGWDNFQALWKALPEPADFLRQPSTLTTP